LLRNDNERLRKENLHLERDISEYQQQLSDMKDEHSSLQQHLHTEQQKVVLERKVQSQLVDELSKELEELRQCKSELLRRSPAVNISDLPRSIRKEMEIQIYRLKQDNAQLREELEDLQAQLLSRHVHEGKSLLVQSEKSLATELEKLPKNELMKTIQKEQEANQKLRDYVEFITLRILEKNPSILEINSKQK
jgi:Rab11 family-interacting protein 3/4